MWVLHFLPTSPARAEYTVDKPRMVQSLDQGWKFFYGDAPGAESVTFTGDTQWQSVDLPHTWNARDGVDGVNKGKYARGTGWYRLRFTPDAPGGDRRSYLRFDAVSTVSKVWLNGQVVGEHFSAYSAAVYDVTDLIKPGVENILVVRANNEVNPDVPSLSADYTFFGGIYRPVYLITANSLSIDPLDHSSPGVYLTTPNITPATGDVNAKIRVRNASKTARKATVSLTIFDADGKSVATASLDAQVAAGAVSEQNISVSVPNPHLWNGRSDPYLYSAQVAVSEDQASTDSIHQPLGFRTYRFDPNLGFILNGKPYDLHGVNVHQDREGKGWAVSDADRQQDFQLVSDMGATWVRLAHYQHAQEDYDLCDKLGLCVWAENCMVNSIGGSDAFSTNSVNQTIDLIRQCYNHPSIVTWSIANEIRNAKGPNPHDLLWKLAGVVKQEDPTRPSTIACCKSEAPGSDGTVLTAFNKYFGWYGGDVSMLAPYLAKEHATYPDACVGISEYGAGASVNLHSASPKKNDHTEEYQDLFHETYWQDMDKCHWLWCKSIWSMFDFASAGRHEGDRAGINDKGMVTRDRKIKKDAYFWYQSNWSDKPMVYIASRRFTDRADAKTQVKVYSNCDQVTLTLNGQSLGSKTSENHIFLWPDVTLAAGQNQIAATASKGAVTVNDSCRWTLKAE